MLKSLHIDPEKCTGYLQCELARSYENEGIFKPAKSRIKVFNFHDVGRQVPYTCTQCDAAWCFCDQLSRIAYTITGRWGGRVTRPNNPHCSM